MTDHTSRRTSRVGWFTDLTPSEQQRRERAHRIECANCRAMALEALERDIRNRKRHEFEQAAAFGTDQPLDGGAA